MPISDLLAAYPRPNLLIVVTDQQRDLAAWPAPFRETLRARMPATQQLAAHGLTFRNAFTSAGMCSPSRAALLTGRFPSTIGVTRTGTPQPPVGLPTPADGVANLASLLATAGYRSQWIGKWHLGTGDDPATLEPWGFAGWAPPDAGNTLGVTHLGGGTRGPLDDNRNDDRYIARAADFLDAPPASPWCLVLSLVNPHDAHLGLVRDPDDPDVSCLGAFYDLDAIDRTGAPLPENHREDLAAAGKPRAQSGWAWDDPESTLQPPFGPGARRRYVDGYAHLIAHVEAQLADLLEVMSDAQRERTLVVRTSDHGEMGLAHGLVAKFCCAYDEVMRVPLLLSNPIAYPQAATTDALASHVDLVPTLANALGLGDRIDGVTGADLRPVLDDPTHPGPSLVHYTYDDIGDAFAPSVVRTIRSHTHKYSVYLRSTKDGSDADWELYDLRADPQENDNLAGRAEHAGVQARLDAALVERMQAAGTEPTFLWPPTPGPDSRGVAPET